MMAGPPSYARRFARLPEVFEILGAHPAGVPLDRLADRLAVDPDELREDLLAFFAADVGGLLGLSRPSALDFLSADGGEEVDPNQAEIVRLIDERPADELGVERVDAAELALIYTAARALLDLEPENADLASALDALVETMVGDRDAAEAPGERAPGDVLGTARAAASARARMRIVYSRSWRRGVTERVIEPHRLVQTRRGWEVDAGDRERPGELRTFLIANIREAELTDELFSPPPDLAERLERHRRTETVRVQIPHQARWAADEYAERVRVVADDELDATLDLDLLPPVRDRIGLLLLAAGPDSRVLDPGSLAAAGPELAAELLEHHRRTGAS